MQKPHFDTSMSYTVYYHLHNKTIEIHGHVHSILLVIFTTGIERIEAKLTQKNRIVKRCYIVKVASNDSTGAMNNIHGTPGGWLVCAFSIVYQLTC
jgi:calcineurin-like phosphoesterase family protein